MSHLDTVHTLFKMGIALKHATAFLEYCYSLTLSNIRDFLSIVPCLLELHKMLQNVNESFKQ